MRPRYLIAGVVIAAIGALLVWLSIPPPCSFQDLECGPWGIKLWAGVLGWTLLFIGAMILVLSHEVPPKDATKMSRRLTEDSMSRYIDRTATFKP